MHYLVYRTTNLVNGKCYIGVHQTDDLQDGYLGSGTLLKRAIEKHGKESFTREILFSFQTKEEMFQKEAELVDQEFVNREDTYNITLGGSGGFYHTWNHPDEQVRQKMYDNSIAHLKKATTVHLLLLDTDPVYLAALKKRSSINAKKMLATNLKKYPETWWKGKTHREDTKKKIGQANSLSCKGERNSNYGNEWITNGVENLRHKRGLPYPEGFYKGRINGNVKKSVDTSTELN